MIDGGYPAQDWLTFRQALAAGGCVRRGERGRTIFYADSFTPKNPDRRVQPGEDGETRAIRFLKRFTVFNVAQCDGLPERFCRHGHRITIDGHIAGVAPAADRLGRPLPAWSGCKRLRSGELFVMSPDAPASFDGRYFGVLPMKAVIGRATPVWTDEAGTGARVWFAEPRANRPSDSANPINQGDLS